MPYRSLVPKGVGNLLVAGKVHQAATKFPYAVRRQHDVTAGQRTKARRRRGRLLQSNEALDQLNWRGYIRNDWPGKARDSG